MANKRLEKRLDRQSWQRICRQTEKKVAHPVWSVISSAANGQCLDRVRIRVWFPVAAPIFEVTWFEIRDQAAEDYRD